MFSRFATHTATTLASRSQRQRYVLNLSRGFAKKFDRTKPHVNIGTIGHVDHGKVGLLGYIGRVWSDYFCALQEVECLEDPCSYYLPFSISIYPIFSF
jgi:hypothetical protein